MRARSCVRYELVEIRSANHYNSPAGSRQQAVSTIRHYQVTTDLTAAERAGVTELRALQFIPAIHKNY